MRRAAVLVLAIAVAAPLQAQVPRPAAPIPPRDAVGPAPTGTGRIRGRVMIAGTTMPARRAQITLTGEGNLLRIVTTDGDGRYEISDLPAGRFTLTAAKGGYVTTPYGQRRAFEPGRPVVLAAGQVLGQVDVGLRRGGVIVAQVMDVRGEPAIGAEIAVERYQYGTDGQRRLTRVSLGSIGPSTTDDRGAFRAFGLTPGEYVVSANVRQRPQLPGQAATGAPVVGSLQTYFPGTPNAADAQGIVLDAGEEANVQFRLVSGRLANVSGTVIDSTGRPASGANLMLTSPAPNGTASGRGVGSTKDDGTFSIARVPPGEHFVQIRLSPRPGDSAEGEVANMAVSVAGDNIEQLQIVTAPAMTVKGQIVWEGEAARTGGPGGLRITANPTDGRPALLGLIGAGSPSANGNVGRDDTFELGGLSGTVRFVPQGVPPLWTLKAILAGNDDIADTGIDIGSVGDARLRVVLTDKTTEITGTVRDAAGAPVTEFVVVVLPEAAVDAAAAPRYTRAIRSDQKGSFQLRALPAGRYVVAAVPGLEPGSEWDPSFQATIRSAARRFTLEDGQSLALTLELMP
jgi:hypothetical protein